MALNLKNAEVERLAAEAAALAGESKTEAVRQALIERVRRLRAARGRGSVDARVTKILKRFRDEFPQGDFGRPMTKAEREEILGYSPEGV
jgi:antitoxin VapB